jgi:small-conductance mechanosensitive channel
VKESSKYLSRSYEINDLLLPLVIILSAGVLGVILEALARKFLRNRSRHPEWKTPVELVSSLRGILVVWFMLIAVSAVMDELPLSAKGEALVNRIAAIVLIISVTVLVARLITGYINITARRNTSAFPAISLVKNLVRIIVFIVGALTIFRTLGISVTPMLTALGVGGLAVALALQDTLSNLFAGIYIIASRQINRGDFIKLSTGEEGTISDIAWRVTTLSTPAGQMVVIPNAKVAQTSFTNFSKPNASFIASATLTFHHEADLTKVLEIMRSAAVEVKEAFFASLPSEPSVMVSVVTEPGVTISASLRVADRGGVGTFRNEFYLRVLPRLMQNEIPLSRTAFGPQS